MDDEIREIWKALLSLVQQFRLLVTEVNTSNPYVQPLTDLENRIATRLQKDQSQKEVK